MPKPKNSNQAASSAAGETLSFDYTILRSDNNCIIQVPSLTHQGLILSKIDFEADFWFFEAVLKSNAQELVKLTSTYFQHHHDLDLMNYRAKLEEGDKLELHVKPKAAPKNINLKVTYHYSPSEGAITYQHTIRLTEVKLPETALLKDICQHNPTKLLVKAQDPILKLALTPKFHASHADKYPSWGVTPSEEEPTKQVEIDFTQPEMKEILPMLQHYEMDIRVDCDEKKELDAQLYFLCYAFKN